VGRWTDATAPRPALDPSLRSSSSVALRRIALPLVCDGSLGPRLCDRLSRRFVAHAEPEWDLARPGGSGFCGLSITLIVNVELRLGVHCSPLR